MKSRILSIALMFMVLLASSGIAQATSSFWVKFGTAYPAAKGSSIDTCTLCHASMPSLNSYGSDYAAGGFSFQGIASMDSDGDGFTNVQEINALTFPGNASVHPAPSVTLSSIVINGAASVDENTGSTYTATASYSKGKSKTVSPTWSLTSPYATVSSAGVLTVGSLSADQTVTIQASYTEGGVTKTASKSVTVVNQTSTQPGLTFNDNFTDATAAGSPNWESMLGKWIGNKGTYISSRASTNVALVQNVPALEQYDTGRIQSQVMLTPIVSKIKGKKLAPNASIIFGYVDESHYRYVRLRAGSVAIGQVGEFGGEKAGVKAVGNANLSLNKWHSVVVDAYLDGTVRVYIDQRLANVRTISDVEGPQADVAYAFNQAVPGRVGLYALKAKAGFDKFYAWDETVLPIPVGN